MIDKELEENTKTAYEFIIITAIISLVGFGAIFLMFFVFIFLGIHIVIIYAKNKKFSRRKNRKGI